MQELEKILEEIEQRKTSAEKLIVKPPHDKLDQVANDTAEAFIEAYKECQDIIRKHMNDGWISVEDRLPENNKPVLVWARSTARGADEWSLGSYDNGFWALGSYGGSLVFPSHLEAVAWRPLPEPYRPERSDSHDGE